MPQARIPARVVALSALLLCTALVGPQITSATTKVGASGTITVISNVPDSVESHGGTTITHATAHVVFAGTLSGQATEIYTAITHRNGRVSLHGKGFFNGTILGRTGTLDYVFHGDATSGQIVSIHGTGGLRHVHVKLPYALDPATGIYHYRGWVRLS